MLEEVIEVMVHWIPQSVTEILSAVNGSGYAPLRVIAVPPAVLPLAGRLLEMIGVSDFEYVYASGTETVACDSHPNTLISDTLSTGSPEMDSWAPARSRRTDVTATATVKATLFSSFAATKFHE